ncbi:MAG: shikimate kinase [Ignisphaera sp.]|nr:shikimate kinase [Ignisphaera sp.]MCX8167572.1 shikimate kinase [Ignisphaera sp.]MDW8086175.1 shikimate kinase [Ignisphaera sp.]
MYGYGGVSIVNAIPAWLGSVMAVDLKAHAEASVCSSDCEHQSPLIRTVVGYFREKYNLPPLKIRIDSEIPQTSGLKSSSAVAVATIKAIAHKFSIYEPSIPRLAAELSRIAGVSITGALDDASAAFYGGIVFTDNLNMNILRVSDFRKDLDVVLLFKGVRRKVDVEELRKHYYLFKHVFEAAYSGDIFRAMTMNGLLIARILGYDENVIRRAIELGALASGVSGNGPTMFAVCREGDCGPLIDYFSAYGSTKIVKPVRISH